VRSLELNMMSEDLSCYQIRLVLVVDSNLKWSHIEEKIRTYVDKQSVEGKIYIIEHFCLFAQKIFWC
jgi:hypothetical protein